MAGGAGYLQSEFIQTPSQPNTGKATNTVRSSPVRTVMPQFLPHVRAVSLMASHDPVEI